MTISVFGLGHVGTTLMGCLAKYGHEVVGVDVNPQKVRTIQNGASPVAEQGVGELIADGVAEDRITATTTAATAIEQSSLSFVTVGTPLDDTGQLSTTNIYTVMDSVVEPLAATEDHTVVIRSTVPPRTTRAVRAYLDDRLPAETTVTLAVNPEFLREGSAIADFFDPPYVVVGAFAEDSVDDLLALYDSLAIDGEIRVVSPELAEAIKLVNNAFHALQICFANEVGSVAAAAGVDGKALMELVCADTKLNLSEQYLDPGFAFGGSCLPKDTRAITTLGSDRGVSVPLLSSIVESNEQQLDRVREYVEQLDGDRVGIAGLSFKSDTVDFRNSPGLRLARHLDSEVVLYVGDLDLTETVGTNRERLDRSLDQLDADLVRDAEAFAEAADIVVFTNDGEYADLVAALDSTVVCDPVGTVRTVASAVGEYHSITW